MKYQDMTVQHMDLGLYAGDIAITLPPIAVKPRLEWRGAPIDRETFRIALAFLKWTHDEHKVEGQARFFYNQTSHKWRPVALPQYIWSAGHTREVEENNETKEKIISELLNAGFGEAGTIHHHSGMGAFQSSGDKTDELSRHGFHVTVGHMHGDIADFHARATFKKINYEMEDGMLNVAEWLPGLRTRTVNRKMLSFNPLINGFWLDLKNLPEFPEDWKKLLVERPEVKTVTTYTSRGGVRTSYTSTADRSYQLKEAHKNDTPIYEDTLYVIWLRGPQTGLTITKKAFTNETHTNETRRSQLAAPKKEHTTHSSVEPSKSEEKEAVKPKTDWTAEELKNIHMMTNEQFDDYLAGLKSAGLLASSDSVMSVRDMVVTALVDMRDRQIPDELDAEDLEELCSDIQRLSSWLIRKVALMSRNMIGTTLPPERDVQELLCQWMADFARMCADMTKEEWEASVDACTIVDTKDSFDFYELMCVGLDEAAALGHVDDIYNNDGTVVSSARFPQNR
jgi:hypothetical protein